MSAAEAARRFASRGPNRLVDPPPDPAWKALARQFNDVLIRGLIGAGILSGVIGGTKDVVVITAMIVLNAVVGFLQERRAEAALLAVRRMLATTTPVRRGGQTLQLPSEQVVRGDLVMLEPGERSPADGRVIAAPALRIDESSLTGESEPSLSTGPSSPHH